MMISMIILFTSVSIASILSLLFGLSILSFLAYILQTVKYSFAFLVQLLSTKKKDIDHIPPKREKETFEIETNTFFFLKFSFQNRFFKYIFDCIESV